MEIRIPVSRNPNAAFRRPQSGISTFSLLSGFSGVSITIREVSGFSIFIFPGKKKSGVVCGCSGDGFIFDDAVGVS
ncbi:MAG: hypothetical protein M0Q93_12225 [Terrimicrobiaceae bacterium]|nr:hypothetical protein [Terrimicrobiaceae bacterium]